MVTVKISEKGGQQSNYEFDTSEVTIGRMKGNDIVLPKGNVSKKHARLYDRGGTLTIEDLDSTNGTYVNGRRVTSEQEISESDKIYIGDFILQIQPDRQNAPPEAPPQPPGESSPGGSQAGGPPSSPPRGGQGNSSGSSSGGQRDPLQQKYDSSSPKASTQSGTESSRGGSRAGERGAPNDTSMGGGSGARSSTRRDSSLGNQESDRNTNPPPERSSSSSTGPPSPSAASGDRGGAPRSESSQPAPEGGSSGSSGRADQQIASSNRSAHRESSLDAQSPPSSGPSDPSKRSQNKGAPSPPSKRPEPSDRDDAAGSSSRPGSGPSADDAPEISPSGLASGERSEGQLTGERRQQGGHVSIPSPTLRDNFDEAFHEHQRAVAEVLIETLEQEEMWPPDDVPSPTMRDRYRDAIDDAIDSVDPPVDTDELRELLLGECVELGPLDLYLDDQELRRIHVDAYDRIVLAYDDERVLARRAFSHPACLEAVATRLSESSSDDASSPVHHTSLEDGTRVQIGTSSLSTGGPTLTLEPPRPTRENLDDLVQDGVLSSEMRDVLVQAVEAGQSMLIAGPPETNTSRILGALAREIPEASRLAVVEDTPRLELPHSMVVSLQSASDSGEDAVEIAEGMRVDRVLLDSRWGHELRGWIRAAVSGTRGNLATIRALDALDALDALESAVLLEPQTSGRQGVRRQIARAIDLVIVLDRDREGGERIRRISELRGLELETFHLEDIFYIEDGEGLAGAFEATGYIPRFYEDLRHAGLDVDFDLFRT